MVSDWFTVNLVVVVEDVVQTLNTASGLTSLLTLKCRKRCLFRSERCFPRPETHWCRPNKASIQGNERGAARTTA